MRGRSSGEENANMVEREAFARNAEAAVFVSMIEDVQNANYAGAMPSASIDGSGASARSVAEEGSANTVGSAADAKLVEVEVSANMDGDAANARIVVETISAATQGSAGSARSVLLCILAVTCRWRWMVSKSFAQLLHSAAILVGFM